MNYLKNKFWKTYKNLYCDRVDVSEKIDANKQVNQKSAIFATIGIF